MTRDAYHLTTCVKRGGSLCTTLPTLPSPPSTDHAPPTVMALVALPLVYAVLALPSPINAPKNHWQTLPFCLACPYSLTGLLYDTTVYHTAVDETTLTPRLLHQDTRLSPLVVLDIGPRGQLVLNDDNDVVREWMEQSPFSYVYTHSLYSLSTIYLSLFGPSYLPFPSSHAVNTCIHSKQTQHSSPRRARQTETAGDRQTDRDGQTETERQRGMYKHLYTSSRRL